MCAVVNNEKIKDENRDGCRGKGGSSRMSHSANVWIRKKTRGEESRVLMGTVHCSGGKSEREREEKRRKKESKTERKTDEGRD